MIPWPYDYIYWWKDHYGVKMSKKAEDELIKHMVDVVRKNKV